MKKELIKFVIDHLKTFKSYPLEFEYKNKVYDYKTIMKTINNRKQQASRRDNMKKTYQFDVPCVYYYEIDADTEEQARKILLDKGGLDIDGDLCLDEDNYKRAELVGVLQPQASEQKR